MDMEDYSDVGNPLDSVRVDSDNEYLGDEDLEDEFMDNMPAVNVSEAVAPPARETSSDVDAVVAALVSSCEELGIEPTSAMMNQVISYSGKEEITEDNLKWYVRGVVISMTSQLLPRVSDSISDLRAEIRHLQTSSNNLNNAANKIDKQAGRFSSELKKVSETLGDKFSSALTEVSRNHIIYPGPKTDNSTLKINPVDTEETENPIVPDAAVIGQPAKEATVTKPDDSDILKLKRKFMMNAGIAREYIDMLGVEGVNATFPNDLYIEIKDTKARNELKIIADALMSQMVEWLENQE